MIYGKFLGTEQQDCNEFLLTLLNNFEKCLSYNYKINIEENSNNIITKLKYESEKNILDYYNLYGKSKIFDLFYGQYINSIICQKCNNRHYTFEIFNTIELPISVFKKEENEYNIYDLLSKFTSTEEIIDDYQCLYCKEKTSAYKKINIYKSPKYLIISLKRFDNKLNKIISDFDTIIDLDLKPYFVDMEEIYSYENHKSIDVELLEKHNTNYKLSSIICHRGSYSFGHYYTIVNKNNNYYLCNDVNISKIENLRDLNKNCYIYIYNLI